MKAVSGTVFVLAACVLGTASVHAQGSTERSVEQYLCKDLVRESGRNRDIAVAFLHGFILGKSGRSTFTPDVLHKQTDAFIDRCIENPSEKAVDAMMKVKN